MYIVSEAEGSHPRSTSKIPDSKKIPDYQIQRGKEIIIPNQLQLLG
jgi:ribonuclease HIII